MNLGQRYVTRSRRFRGGAFLYPVVWFSLSHAIWSQERAVLPVESEYDSVQVQTIEGKEKEIEDADRGSVELGIFVEATPGRGVYISHVAPGSPADDAGVQPGDFILSINSVDVSSPQQLHQAIADKKSGDTVSVLIWRRGQEIRKEIALATRPAEGGEQHAWLGVALVPVDGGGVRVARIYPGGPAAQARLRRGDIIVKIDSDVTNSVDDVIQILERSTPGTTAKLTIHRDSQERSIRVSLGAMPHSVFRQPAVDETPPGNMPRQRSNSGSEFDRLESKLDELRHQIELLRKDFERLRTQQSFGEDSDSSSHHFPSGIPLGADSDGIGVANESRSFDRIVATPTLNQSDPVISQIQRFPQRRLPPRVPLPYRYYRGPVGRYYYDRYRQPPIPYYYWEYAPYGYYAYPRYYGFHLVPYGYYYYWY